MEYAERFTDRVFDNEEIACEEASYVAKVHIDERDLLLERLGQYEDLGFSPEELADILLDLESIDTDRKELLLLVKKRSAKFDREVFYLLHDEKRYFQLEE